VSPASPNNGISDDNVDLRALKALAASMLPSTSSTRLAIASLPDSLPRKDAASKVEVLVTLLYAEFGR
jgi:hypothetical protein